MSLSLPSWVRMLWKPGFFFLSCFQKTPEFLPQHSPGSLLTSGVCGFPFTPRASDGAALRISVSILSLSIWRLGCGNHENAFIMSDYEPQALHFEIVFPLNLKDGLPLDSLSQQLTAARSVWTAGPFLRVEDRVFLLEGNVSSWPPSGLAEQNCIST